MRYRDISADQARAVLKILKEECGYLARDEWTDTRFIRIITTTHVLGRVRHEYRFIGALGFSGKFWNNGNNNNVPYVDCCREHETPERLAMINKANERLRELFASVTSAATTAPAAPAT